MRMLAELPWLHRAAMTSTTVAAMERSIAECGDQSELYQLADEHGDLPLHCACKNEEASPQEQAPLPAPREL